MIEKTCSKCGETKPLSEYYKGGKGSRYADGYRSQCKQCQSEYQTKWFKKNKDYADKRAREYTANHREVYRNANTTRRTVARCSRISGGVIKKTHSRIRHTAR